MKRKAKFIVPMVLLGAAVMLAFGYGFMLLWNWLIPDLFHGPSLTFWQGIGLLLLFKILFGHPGGKWHRGRCWHGKNCDHARANGFGNWKHKWHNMSQEEKKAMKQKWKSRFRDWSDEDQNAENERGTEV